MELWTQAHRDTLIPATVLMALLAMVLRRFLGKKDLEVRMLPLKIVACLVLLLELGKQGVSLAKGYDLYCLPFHFCSLFIFMLPLAAFYRGRWKKSVWEITGALCTAVFMLMMIYPSLIYGQWNIENFFQEYMSFHTVAFHNLVVLAFFLMVALELHDPECKADNRAIALFMLGFCTVSATMAQLLKTNFNNFYSCNIPPLETLRISIQGVLGVGLTQLLYVLIVTVLDFGFVFGCYALCRLAWRLAAQRRTRTPV